MRMAEHLGKHISSMLQSEPFKNWAVERSTEDDLDEQRIFYVFTGRSLYVECDRDERVCTLFMRAEECEGFTLSEIPFALDRKQLLERLGSPSKSGASISDPVLGSQGAWDRFTRPHYVVHVQYQTERDAIYMITLMRPDVVP
jgi:hypothetical protein